MRTDNLKNNKSNVRDPRGESLDQRILRLQSIYDTDITTGGKPERDPDVIVGGRLNPRQYKQMMNYLTREKKKSNTEDRREPNKDKPIPKTPTKFAKSAKDIKDEFEVIEIPMLMKEFEEFILENPSKNFQDFLKNLNGEVKDLIYGINKEISKIEKESNNDYEVFMKKKEKYCSEKIKVLLFDKIFIIKFALCDSIIFPNEIFDILGIFLYKFTNLNQ